jgi:hypothetical protein
MFPLPRPGSNTIPEWFERVMRAGYFAAVSLADHHLGIALDALDESGLADQTLTIFTADHGYSLGEHSEWVSFLSFFLSFVRSFFLSFFLSFSLKFFRYFATCCQGAFARVCQRTGWIGYPCAAHQPDCMSCELSVHATQWVEYLATKIVRYPPPPPPPHTHTQPRTSTCPPTLTIPPITAHHHPPTTTHPL